MRTKPKALPVRSVRLSSREWSALNRLAKERGLSRGRLVADLTAKAPTGEPADSLLQAAARWIESCGGTVLVIGGIAIQEWPADPAFTFHVAVKCTGRKPKVVAK